MNSREDQPIARRLRLRRPFVFLLLAVALTATGSAGAQEASPPSPPGTATIYLVNVSRGRALFIISTHGPRFFFGGEQNRPKDEQVACDVASSSIFGQNTLFPGSWCRIYVDITHDLWLWAVVYYPETRCFGGGGPYNSAPSCIRAADPYRTRPVHLTKLPAGGLYEFDACGQIGVGEATCGWRQITPQDRVY